MNAIAVGLTCVLLLSACGTLPTDGAGRTLSIADAGDPPENTEAALRSVLRYRLKDPDSALVRMLGSKPVAMVTRSSPLLGLNGGAGWKICAEVNAKNSYGAYVGYQRVYLLWNAGKAVDYLEGELGAAACKGYD